MQIFGFIRWLGRYALYPLLCLVLVLLAFHAAVLSQLHPVFLSEDKPSPYEEFLPKLHLSNGWNLADIQLREKKAENHFQQLKNVPIHVKSYTDIEPSGKNRTRDSNVLIYNRIPKCASTTMQFIIKHLQRINSFKAESSGVYHRKVLSPFEVKQLVGKFRNRDSKIVYDRHMYHIDWERHGVEATLINVVREPVKRLVSKFHYLRSPSRWANRYDRPPLAWFNKDLETCVFSDDPECNYGHVQELQLTYFCGTEWECGDGKSKKALQKAKENIESVYSVVGVLENLNTSLAVMELYIPGFFTGATKILAQTGKADRNRNSYPPPSQNVINKLRSKLGNEFELYEFVQQRLRRQEQYLQQY